jgi:hypothetical protein
MPDLTSTFEFYNPWSTTNYHTTQPSITMPQMVNGQRAMGPLTLFSEKLPAAGYYGLGSRTHAVTYTIEGSFKGSCMIQVSVSPNPSDTDWIDLTDTQINYTGLETTGGAGISGGFSGSTSRPTKTDLRQFTGLYSYIRARLNISQGTLQSIRLNF